MRCTKWQRLPFSSKQKIKRGLWSPEEDEKLFNYMMQNGLLGCSWSYVAKQIGLQRCGKSCRLRWINYLRPGLKRGAISPEEEQLIINLHSILGNRWSQIVAYLPGRTDNDIKNYWNSCIKKKLNSKQWLPSSSTAEANDNKNIKSNYLNLVDTAENEYSCLQDVLDLKYEQVNEQNKLLQVDPDCSLITPSDIAAWSASHSYSMAADFTDIYPGAYNAHKVEDYLWLKEKATNQSCPSQFSTPEIICTDVDQYSDSQAQGRYDYNDLVNWRYDEVYLGVPTYVNIHRQYTCQMPQSGGVQDVDQQNCATIPMNEEGKGQQFQLEY